MFDGFACAPQYFACSLHRADPDVLSCFGCAFTQIGGCIDGMKRHQVDGALPRSLRRAADAFSRTLADVSRTRSKIMFGAGMNLRVLGPGRRALRQGAHLHSHDCREAD
jgi:hypothetical protein